METTSPQSEIVNLDLSTRQEMSTFQARNFVVGFVGNKLGLKPRTNPPADSWITLKGKGKLFEPTDELHTICETIDTFFEKFNGSGLRICQRPLEQLVKSVHDEHPHFPLKVVHLYLKVKFYARLRLLNSNTKMKSLLNNKSICSYKQTAQFVN